MHNFDWDRRVAEFIRSSSFFRFSIVNTLLEGLKIIVCGAVKRISGCKGVKNSDFQIY